MAVNDTEELAANLLPIAGRRMMAYLSKTPDLLEEVSRISPTLTTYLEGLVRRGIYKLLLGLTIITFRSVWPEQYTPAVQTTIL